MATPGSKIAEAEAVRVVELLKSGWRPVRVARELQIPFNCVRSIKTGRAWKHISGGPIKVPFLPVISECVQCGGVVARNSGKPKLFCSRSCSYEYQKSKPRRSA